MTYKKKLIEVALPLEAINRESARENYIYRGNPSAIHKWWAQRPLAACRAVLFASLVDDPSSRTIEFPTEEAQDRERERLFQLIEKLVVWESSTDSNVLSAAREEILRSTDGHPPAVLDPFCGGGTIPLEAQRLGLEAHGSDLNPIPVLITKALIEIPPRFANCLPVNPNTAHSLVRGGGWQGTTGLAEDIAYYGQRMRDEAWSRVGHLYPRVTLPTSLGGGEATVIAWLWARTVQCPNPACGANAPLFKSTVLSSRKGKERWAEPIIDRHSSPPRVDFRIRVGKPSKTTGTIGRRGGTCVACGTPIPLDHIRAAGKRNALGTQMLAMVAESANGRVYLDPDQQQITAAKSASPGWAPETELPEQALGLRVQAYGMRHHRDLFTIRQQACLSALADSVPLLRNEVRTEAAVAWPAATEETLDAYADALALYMAFVISKHAPYGCSLVPWFTKEDRPSWAFGRQTLSMVWDFAEVNPFSEIGGSVSKAPQIIAEVIEQLPAIGVGDVVQRDASSGELPVGVLVSTDPPYYDNVPYADLSDFFFVWLKRALGSVYPDLFSTMLAPKAAELVADPFRYGGREQAEAHFLAGMRRAFGDVAMKANREFPVTIYYAFKQSETDEDGGVESVSSTGWETILEGIVDSGLSITGTWPLRTERSGRLRDSGSNALASSIVLVCRRRAAEAATVSRRQFLAELQRELPVALKALQHGSIAPVDLAQSAIGPGMAVFSRYSRVLESDGSPMGVRTALALINQVLAETLSEQEGEMDADTRWALTWFDQFGFGEGPFGDADTLAKAKVTSTQGLVEARIVASARGKVRLLRREELPPDWDPTTDARRTVWEATHYLIRALEADGEQAAAALLARLGDDGDRARDLAYRLYTTSERRGWAQDAQAYNSLGVAWPEIARQAIGIAPARVPEPGQRDIFA